MIASGVLTQGYNLRKKEKYKPGHLVKDRFPPSANKRKKHTLQREVDLGDRTTSNLRGALSTVVEL